MAAVVTVRISGLKEVNDKLMNMLPKEVRAAVRPAMKDAGDWMVNKIAAEAPDYAGQYERGYGKKNILGHRKQRRAGFLKSHIVSKVLISAKQDLASVSVGPAKAAFYAGFVEFGSIHNEPANPFITRAYEANKETWLQILIADLRAALGL